MIIVGKQWNAVITAMTNWHTDGKWRDADLSAALYPKLWCEPESQLVLKTPTSAWKVHIFSTFIWKATKYKDKISKLATLMTKERNENYATLKYLAIF